MPIIHLTENEISGIIKTKNTEKGATENARVLCKTEV